MTLLGFKDVEAEGLNTYAGTSFRISQKVVTSEAVCRGWSLTAIDVKEAFVKGITCEEVARTTSEPSREVNSELKAEAMAALRQLPGCEDVGPRAKVLHCTKLGAGCKGATRCFAIKPARATSDIFGYRPITTDDQLIVGHRNVQLDFIGTTHVEDIKTSCDFPFQKGNHCSP